MTPAKIKKQIQGKGATKPRVSMMTINIVLDGHYKDLKMSSHPPVIFEQNTDLTLFAEKKKEGNKQSLQSI